MNTVQAAVLLRAFGDGTRLRILNILARRQMSVTELAGLLQCPFHRVSRHLRYLLLRGIVNTSFVGNAAVYRLSDSANAIRQAVLPAVLDVLADMPDARDDAAKLRRQGTGEPAAATRRRRSSGGRGNPSRG